MKQPKHVVVAGGAGFLGSNLCEALVHSGSKVTCIDNLSTGRHSNISALLDWPEFKFVVADLLDDIPDVGKVDRVYHLASPASPPGYKKLPIETIRVNTEGTRKLLELAHRTGARFLFASTSEAYGDPLEHPQREDYRGNVSSVGPRSMYDESKRCGEALTVAFEQTFNVDARIVRIFNTYGPRSDPADGRLVPNFVCQALAGAPMTVYGTGSQTRSLCYVDDLVRGLVAAMEAEGARGQVINLGNPVEHTVKEYAEIIRDLAGSRSPIVYRQPAVGDDPQRRRPDIARARALLGWNPIVSLADGLSATIEYFRQETRQVAELTA